MGTQTKKVPAPKGGTLDFHEIEFSAVFSKETTAAVRFDNDTPNPLGQALGKPVEDVQVFGGRRGSKHIVFEINPEQTFVYTAKGLFGKSEPRRVTVTIKVEE